METEKIKELTKFLIIIFCRICNFVILLLIIKSLILSLIKDVPFNHWLWLWYFVTNLVTLITWILLKSPDKPKSKLEQKLEEYIKKLKK